MRQQEIDRIKETVETIKKRRRNANASVNNKKNKFDWGLPKAIPPKNATLRSII